MADGFDKRSVQLKAEALKKRLEELRESEQITDPDFVIDILKRIEKATEEMALASDPVTANLAKSPEMVMGDLGVVSDKLDNAEAEGVSTPESLQDEMESEDGAEDGWDAPLDADEMGEGDDATAQSQSGGGGGGEEPAGESIGDRLRDANEKRKDLMRRAKKAKERAQRLKKVDDVADTAKDAKKAQQAARAAKAAKTAQTTAKTAKVARGVATAAKVVKGVAMVISPTTWIVVAIVVILLLVLILAFAIFGGVVNKVTDEAGGSIFVSLNCESDYDTKLVDDVLYWTENPEEGVPRLGVTESLKEDLRWQGDVCGTDMTHKLDRRVLETLRYLVSDEGGETPGLAWPYIGVGILTNGPHNTFRPPSDKEQKDFEMDAKTPISAFSAYRTGQAIGITAVGMTSAELTQAMGLTLPVPVQVPWQRMIEAGTLYPAYEQMQLDASELYQSLISAQRDLTKMKATLEIESEEEPTEEELAEEAAMAKGLEDFYDIMTELMDNLIKNLRRVESVDNDSMLDVTKEYMMRARENLMGALADVEAAKTESLLAGISVWLEGIENPDADGVEEADTQTYQKIREGIRFVFRAMQVANMDGWQGNTNNLGLWRAYEARSNIRQLVLDILRMPFEFQLLHPERGPEPVVRQMIVFSPEDDLDNGLPDVDVYPDGAVAVSDGGVAFLPRQPSDSYTPVVDIWDTHFSSLRVDNGILFKACTDFIYDIEALKKEEAEGDELLLGAFTPSDEINGLCEILYGKPDYDLKENQKVGRVSYQEFVHIGF